MENNNTMKTIEISDYIYKLLSDKKAEIKTKYDCNIDIEIIASLLIQGHIDRFDLPIDLATLTIFI